MNSRRLVTNRGLLIYRFPSCALRAEISIHGRLPLLKFSLLAFDVTELTALATAFKPPPNSIPGRLRYVFPIESRNGAAVPSSGRFEIEFGGFSHLLWGLRLKRDFRVPHYLMPTLGVQPALGLGARLASRSDSLRFYSWGCSLESYWLGVSVFDLRTL